MNITIPTIAAMAAALTLVPTGHAEPCAWPSGNDCGNPKPRCFNPYGPTASRSLHPASRPPHRRTRRSSHRLCSHLLATPMRPMRCLPLPLCHLLQPMGIRSHLDADSQGFVGYPVARCNDTNPAVAMGRTSESLVVICQTGVGRFYYKGVGLQNGLSVEIDDPVQTGPALGAGAVMASPRPMRYVPRSQAISPWRGSDPGSRGRRCRRPWRVPVERAAAAARLHG